MFEAAMEQVDKKQMGPHYEKLIEKSWNRIKGLENYLLPADVKLLFKPKELRNVLYRRKANG